MDMTMFLDTVITTPVMITSLSVGVMQETVKRVLVAWKANLKGHPAFSTLNAVAPLVAGTLLGLLVIPDGGVAPPPVMGFLAGAFSGTLYGAVSPYLKKWLDRSKDESNEVAP